MVTKREDMRTEERMNMRGGPGKVSLRHIVESDGLKHGRLFAEIVLNPGDGIGPHQHSGETEYYYILEGSGTVTEDEGIVDVKSGDVVITGGGASHSIDNTGSSILRFVAVIILA